MFGTKKAIRGLSHKTDTLFRKVKDINRNIQRHDADIRRLGRNVNTGADDLAAFEMKITECEVCGCLVYKTSANKGASTITKKFRLFPFNVNERIKENYYCKTHNPNNKPKPKKKPAKKEAKDD